MHQKFKVTHLQPHSESEASLGSVKPCLKNKTFFWLGFLCGRLPPGPLNFFGINVTLRVKLSQPS